MISKAAITSFQLPPHTIRSCRDLYEELARHPKKYQSLKETLSHFESDPQALNKLWWVLNYHAENFDKTRKLRAWVESRLEELADDRKRRHPLQA
ncbi:hypothetical protein [Desulfoluna spongiiphila]|uniref:Uncharacterized protein n=1 Tax=Desulfoluna spongiiphila TaxID=419481 RepID=A0A1G5JB01_9BACT|nr:hypothetical protein [Desulfoluna spongiiphila]SCY84888.1 hypothetical protein SAMN05216233_12661 [Desulfoluna spongiiphila]VVS90997.1 hypothetical protein DBB_5650 [Desulfoluna spongiiphila]